MYFYREGGHSKPAPHFYLETLRNRLVSPLLEAKATKLQFRKAYPHNGGIFVECLLHFLIENRGKTAAYKWGLVPEKLPGVASDRFNDFVFNTEMFPRGWGGLGGVHLDITILPSLSWRHERPLGLVLRPHTHARDDILSELKGLITSELELGFRIVTETSRGDSQRTSLFSITDHSQLAGDIATVLESPA